MTSPVPPLSPLRLELLGPGEVKDHAGQVVLPAGIPLTVLTYLYLTPAGVSRETLAQLFWPSRDRSLALQSLRQTLTRIRRAIGEDAITTEGRLIRVDRKRLTVDLDAFDEAIEAGDAARALSLWKGGFLSEVRALESSEMEDWLERERIRRQGMILAVVLAACEYVQSVANPDAQALALLDDACRNFPSEGKLQYARFQANLRAGLLARAAGLLEAMQNQPESGLRLEDWEAELEDARAAVASGKQIEIDDPEALTVVEAQTYRRPLLPWLVGGLLLLVLGFQIRLLAPLPPSKSGLADHVITYCRSDADANGDTPHQLYWMDLDGRNHQRMTRDDRCTFLWLEEAGIGVHVYYNLESAPHWLDRMTPPTDPLSEWDVVPLEAKVEGFTISENGFHGGPPVVAGRYVLLRGVQDDGQVAIFLADPVADTVRQVTPLSHQYREPVWDPVREEIILQAEVDGTLDLWAIKAFDPEAPWERLTRSPTQDARPAVHNDKVLFVRGWGTGPTEGDYAIHLLNRTTGEEEVLVSRPWNDFMPRWSPDGRHLCWTSEELGHFESDIWVMDLATRTKRNLTAKVPGRNAECRWGPDSRTVFFFSTGTGHIQIFRARRDNGFVENISDTRVRLDPGWIIPRSAVTASGDPPA